ncbi:MAG TPA: hypothetical protein VGF21_01290 [Thermoleophilaceae bacterium]
MADGNAVRGTTRRPEALEAIGSTGAEAVIADPDRLGTILPLLGDVTVLAWLAGSARLETLLERLVDTPVRGLLYDGAEGSALVRAASERWSIPARVIEDDPADHEAWLAAARRAVGELVSS